MKGIVILFVILAFAAIALMGAAGPEAQAGLTVVGIIILVLAAVFILFKVIQIIAAIIKILIPIAIVVAILGFGILVLSNIPTTSNANAAGAATVNNYPYQYDPETCHLSQTYPPAILQWCGLIEKYASQYNVNPNLIASVMIRESSGIADSYSKSGAVGLLQIMPRDGKAADFNCKQPDGSYLPCFWDRPTSAELFDPEFNVSYGAKMLAQLITLKKGNLRNALKSYGPMDVGYSYADEVLGIMNTYINK